MMDKITGFEFVERMFTLHRNDFVEAMLEYTHGNETEFLELKASVEVRPEDLHPGECATDMLWNIARELIGMVNTTGGVLLIGVRDDDGHDVVPLEKDGDGEAIRRRGFEEYCRCMIQQKIIPDSRTWTYGKRRIEIDDDLNRYVFPKRIPYRGHDIVGYFVKPCDNERIVTVRRFDKGGSMAEEFLPIRKRGDIGKYDEVKWFRNILAYAGERDAGRSSLAKYITSQERKDAKAGDDDFMNMLMEEMARDTVMGKFMEFMLSRAQKGGAESAKPAVAAKYRHSLADLADETSREKKKESLSGLNFEATCIKACGNLGFLGHRDFENGIFLHALVTNGVPIAEGQRWRVTVGVRFNARKDAWCYSAQSAVLVEQSASYRYSYDDISTEEKRARTISSLNGQFFEASCTKGRGNFGFLSLKGFEGMVYIDVPVTNGVQIVAGQRWRFQIGAHCMPPSGVWIYRAVKATLLEDAADLKYTLAALADDSSRAKTAEALRGLRFTAKCTIGRGTCGGLSHPDFEGEIYIDMPVTKGIPVQQGQKWEFEVKPHKMGPVGPWVYRANSVRLLSPAESAAPIVECRARTACEFSESMLADDAERDSVKGALCGRTFKGVIIRDFPRFVFLSCSSFEAGVFCHRSVLGDGEYPCGTELEMEVAPLYNAKKDRWCYAASRVWR